MKNKGKVEEDRKRRTKEQQMVPGEKVYVKNMSKDYKLTSEFNPTPHTVTKAVDGDINVRNDLTGQEYRRHIVHLKKIEGEWKVLNKEGEDNHIEVENED